MNIQTTRSHFNVLRTSFHFHSRESKVLRRVLECCALNGGVFYSSILLFDMVLLPLLRVLLTKILGETSGTGVIVWSWFQPFISILFGMTWVTPLFFLSRIVNSLWFQVCKNGNYFPFNLSIKFIYRFRI